LARRDRVVAADAMLFGGEALLDLLSNPNPRSATWTSPSLRS
jgi:hypothetical protein